MSKKLDTLYFWLLISIVIVSLTIFLIQPYFEAQSFNKLTGGDATYWDALWSELRVDGSSQK